MVIPWMICPVHWKGFPGLFHPDLQRCRDSLGRPQCHHPQLPLHPHQYLLLAWNGRSGHFQTDLRLVRTTVQHLIKWHETLYQLLSLTELPSSQRSIWEILPQVLFPEKFRHPLQEDIGGCGSELWVLLKQVPDDLLEFRGVRASDGSKLTAHYLKRK